MLFYSLPALLTVGVQVLQVLLYSSRRPWPTDKVAISVLHDHDHGSFIEHSHIQAHSVYQLLEALVGHVDGGKVDAVDGVGVQEVLTDFFQSLLVDVAEVGHLFCWHVEE